MGFTQKHGGHAPADAHVPTNAPAPASFRQSQAIGHLATLGTVLVWGLTFVATKVLLRTFIPFEILILRFSLGFLCLCALSPHVLHLTNRKHELLFGAAGFTGVFGYFMVENTALTFTLASNVSVVSSSAPLFIALFATIAGFEHALNKRLAAGFLVAISGIIIMSGILEGDLSIGIGEALALCGAAIWGVYSNILARLGALGYQTIPMTKRIFAWGLLFMLVFSPFMGVNFSAADFTQAQNIGCLLFLGVFASAGCFATWGFAVQRLGASKTGPYIYLQMPITVVGGLLVLAEPFTWRTALGIVLVLCGLLISEGFLSRLRRHHTEKHVSK